MEIRLYSKADDEALLFEMMKQEEEEWICYYGDAAAENYRRALDNSIVYVAYEGGLLCGYARIRNDDGFGIYVYDLLVNKEYRGRRTGRKLIERVCRDYPEDIVYIMSDVDGYYEKQGYRKEGSIFEVKSSDFD